MQLYLDQATSPALGTAINDATVALFLGGVGAGEGVPGDHRRGGHPVSLRQQRHSYAIERERAAPAGPLRSHQQPSGRMAMRRWTRPPAAGPGDRARWLTIALFLAAGARCCTPCSCSFPIVQAAHFSLYKWNGLDPLDDFIGLKNYQVALRATCFVRP